VTDGVTENAPGADRESGKAGEERLRALMLRYQSGHLDGFDELYALASPLIRGFLRSRVAEASRAEDLVQETFLQVHRARHTYDPAYPLRPWLLAIARHTWLMDVRSRSRRLQPTEVVEDIYAMQATSEADRLATRDEVRRALRQVALSGRAPFVLHHVWGYSFAEIAKRMGVTEAAAKLRSSRAMQALKRALGTSRQGSQR
jgi:RNA polymerase sigma-70 factor (ECF subfamily)